jgi:putative ABC transport system permease protein
MLQKYFDNLKNSRLGIFWGNLKLSLFLAFKAIIKGNKWALALLILVMSFSFVNLVFVSGLISGVQTTIDNQMIDTMYANMVVTPLEDKYYIDQSDAVEKKIAAVPEVEAVSPHLNSSALIEYKWKEKTSQSDKGISGTWRVIGIDPVKESETTVIAAHIFQGKYLDENDSDQIIIGVEIAGGEKAATSSYLNLGGANIGDKLRLTYPNGIQREYAVKGIFYARQTVADQQAYVTRKEMTSVMGRDKYFNKSSEILIKSKPGISDELLTEKIKAAGIVETVRSWREYAGWMSNVASTFEVIGSLIGGVGLIISAAVMFIIIYINVLNRKRQIGILRAIGIPGIAITGSYIFQALFYAVAGTLVGLGIVNFGLLPYFHYRPMELPIGLLGLTIKPASIIVSVVGLTLAGALAGLIPSWTIMRQSIIRIIWGA